MTFPNSWFQNRILKKKKEQDACPVIMRDALSNIQHYMSGQTGLVIKTVGLLYRHILEYRISYQNIYI